MSKIYRYYGRCEVGETYKLNIPDPVFDDPREPPFNKSDNIQYFTDTKLVQESPLNEALIVGTRELLSNRFNVNGNPNKDYKIGTPTPTFPKQLQPIIDPISPGTTIHFVSTLDLIEDTKHLYLFTTDQFDTLREQGWRPARIIDQDRINNRSYGNGGSFHRDVEPANVDTSDSIDPPVARSTEVKVNVLGSAEDGGVPHLHCECKVCTEARQDPSRQRLPNSLLISPVTSDSEILFEATPDIRHQIPNTPDAICLSHDFGSQIAGLFSFGSEVVDATRLPVYCSEELAELLRSDGIFSRLIEENNISINAVKPGETVEIENVLIDFYSISYMPGRTNPLAYKIRGSHRDLAYIPKMAGISENETVVDLIEEVDIAVLDGLYWTQESETRSGGVPAREIPEIMDFLDNTDIETEVRFINLNHTNRALHDAAKREAMRARGYDICEERENLYL